MIYQEKKFELPSLIDISKESVDMHLGLYSGYVKNFNAIQALLAELMKDSEKNAHALSELVRRLPFEFDGMRLHEYYFEQWEGAPELLAAGSGLSASLARQYGSAEEWEKQFYSVGMMRGPGWAVLYFDKAAGTFHNAWISEQHQGHFVTLPIILALDVWEHAYLAQYGTTGKGKYIEAFFKNLNWSVMEARFEAATK